MHVEERITVSVDIVQWKLIPVASDNVQRKWQLSLLRFSSRKPPLKPDWFVVGKYLPSWYVSPSENLEHALHDEMEWKDEKTVFI